MSVIANTPASRAAAVTLIAFLWIPPAVGQLESPRAHSNGLDRIRFVDREGNESDVRGSIEDIEGEILTFRRSINSRLELISLPRVTSLEFSRSPLWDAGVSRMRAHKFRSAVSFLDQALEEERRDWAWCEIQATAIDALLQQGRRSEAVDRIEKILERDDRSRHVRRLPLVWDADVPAEDRIAGNADDLKSESEVRRLVAASALLHDETYRSVCRQVLERLQKRSRNRDVSLLAELQRWRLAILTPDAVPALLITRRNRLQTVPVDARPGPQLLLGMLLEREHRYEDAALAYLWGPLTSTTDPALTRTSQERAIRCLERTGRPDQAAQMQREFFPGQKP